MRVKINLLLELVVDCPLVKRFKVLVASYFLMVGARPAAPLKLVEAV